MDEQKKQLPIVTTLVAISFGGSLLGSVNVLIPILGFLSIGFPPLLLTLSIYALVICYKNDTPKILPYASLAISLLGSAFILAVCWVELKLLLGLGKAMSNCCN